jgi:predicted aldo/keto reductase-like oxidoreductase
VGGEAREREMGEIERRPLGRTELMVSAVSLGTEYLLNKPVDHVAQVIRAAVDRGVTYFDLFWAQPGFRDALGAAFVGLRDRVQLAAHLGAVAPSGEHEVSRDPRLALRFFEDFLARYRTDYVDVLYLHNVNDQPDLDLVMGPGGILDLARRLVREGKARAIGFSGHSVPITRAAVASGAIDVLMFPINLAGHAIPGRRELLLECQERGVGVVAMKAYAGGKLLSPGRTLLMESWQRGTEGSVEVPPTEVERRAGLAPITAVQCIAYALAQPAVATVVPGCAELTELLAALDYYQAPAAERDFAVALADFAEPVSGECVYCNHCLPCPVSVDVGATIRLLESAAWLSQDEIERGYRALPVSPSACTDCGVCGERCPFGVDAPTKVLAAAERFAYLSAG